MIPANYTYETFSDYLKNEVLMDTAMELTWVDVVEVAPPNIVHLTDNKELIGDVYPYGQGAFPGHLLSGWLQGGDAQIVVGATVGVTKALAVPSQYNAPMGTVVTAVEASATGYTTLDADLSIGDTTVTFADDLFDKPMFTPYRMYFALDPAQLAVVQPSRVINPAYTAIIDSTLFAIGETDITSISNLQDKIKLRDFGRLYTWKAAMQALAADYDYSTQAGFIGRHTVYQNIKTMHDYETQIINTRYGAGNFFGGTNISTTTSNVEAKW